MKKLEKQINFQIPTKNFDYWDEIKPISRKNISWSKAVKIAKRASKLYKSTIRLTVGITEVSRLNGHYFTEYKN